MSETKTTEVLRGNVLVVEDDAVCGMFMVNTLMKEGYGTRLVKSRDAAVTAIRRYLYEFIILDDRMPGMPVPEFMQAVSSSAARNAVVILTTTESDVVDEAKKFNIPTWLGKPFTPERLLALLNCHRVST